MRKIVAVVGDNTIEKGGLKESLAYQTGRALADCGYRVLSGGLGGIMEAAFRGAKDSSNFIEGGTIGVLPMFKKSEANIYTDIVIPTGLDLYRNITVASSADAVVAIGGGAGTLSEIASAWALKKLVIAYSGVDGWSDKVAGIRMDARNRYPQIPEDKIYGVTSPEEVVRLLSKYIELYSESYAGIKGHK